MKLILPKLKTFVTVEKLPSKLTQCAGLLFSLQEIYNRTDGGWRDNAIMRSHSSGRRGVGRGNEPDLLFTET